MNKDEGSERARVKRARDIKATDSFLLRIAVLFSALVVAAAIVFHAYAQRYAIVVDPDGYPGHLYQLDRLTGDVCGYNIDEQRCYTSEEARYH